MNGARGAYLSLMVSTWLGRMPYGTRFGLRDVVDRHEHSVEAVSHTKCMLYHVVNGSSYQHSNAYSLAWRLIYLGTAVIIHRGTKLQQIDVSPNAACGVDSGAIGAHRTCLTYFAYHFVSTVV